MQNSQNNNGVEFDDKEFNKKIPIVDMSAESPLEEVFIEKVKLPAKVLRKFLLLVACLCFLGALIYFFLGYSLIVGQT